MTLQPQDAFSIPEETVRIAHAAYPKGNIYMQMRDALGPIYHDESFAHLFPHKRLVQGGAEQLLLETMLTLFKERGWLKARGRQRTDSTHVLAKIRAINRVVCVGETMRFALNSLAVVAPHWLLAHCDDTWLDRYVHRFEEAHLPKEQTERQALAEMIGQDGAHLLIDLLAPTAPLWLRQVPAVERLRQIWIQNYLYENGRLCWRANDNIPPASCYVGSTWFVSWPGYVAIGPKRPESLLLRDSFPRTVCQQDQSC